MNHSSLQATPMAQNAYKCANCQGKRLKKLSLLYLQGTANRNSFTIGFYRGLKGNFIANTFGTRQSLLAKHAAPPRKQRLLNFGVLWFVACSVIALILSVVIADSAESIALPASAGLGLLLFVGGVVWRSRAVTAYNTQVWPRAYAQWQRSYLCMQCGRVNVI